MKSMLTRWMLLACGAAIAACLAACQQVTTDGEKKEAAPDGRPIVELSAVTMGRPPAGGMDRFYRELDALTIRDLGATVRFDFIPWGDEKNQISRAIAAKDYDLYVGGGWSDFASFAAKHAFADLAPLLEHVPDLVEHYDGALDGVMVNGKLYGIPQYITPGGGSEGMLYREDLRKAWKLPPIRDLDTAELYLYRAKAAYADTPMINDKRFADNLWTLIAGSNYLDVVKGYAVSKVDEPYRAISIFDTPEYKEVLERAKAWYEDGIVSGDILAAQGNATGETLEWMKQDQKPLEFNNHFGAVSGSYIGVLKELHPDFEYGWFDYDLGNVPSYLPYMTPDNASMISIGAHSKHVEIALRLIEKAHTDRSYYNLLQYGVEGEHYKLDGGKISYEGIEAENRKPGWTGLADGTMNLETQYPGEWQAITEDIHLRGIQLAEANGESPLAGFSFDAQGIAAELGAMEKVKSRHILPLQVGMSSDIAQDLELAKQKLDEAGMPTFMAELQKQLDAFATDADLR